MPSFKGARMSPKTHERIRITAAQIGIGITDLTEGILNWALDNYSAEISGLFEKEMVPDIEKVKRNREAEERALKLSLLAQGRLVAEGGVQAFKEWEYTLTNRELRVMRPVMRDLRNFAANLDRFTEQQMKLGVSGSFNEVRARVLPEMRTLEAKRGMGSDAEVDRSNAEWLARNKTEEI